MLFTFDLKFIIPHGVLNKFFELFFAFGAPTNPPWPGLILVFWHCSSKIPLIFVLALLCECYLCWKCSILTAVTFNDNDFAPFWTRLHLSNYENLNFAAWAGLTPPSTPAKYRERLLVGGVTIRTKLLANPMTGHDLYICIEVIIYSKCLHILVNNPIKILHQIETIFLDPMWNFIIYLINSRFGCMRINLWC